MKYLHKYVPLKSLRVTHTITKKISGNLSLYVLFCLKAIIMPDKKQARKNSISRSIIFVPHQDVGKNIFLFVAHRYPRS